MEIIFVILQFSCFGTVEIHNSVMGPTTSSLIWNGFSSVKSDYFAEARTFQWNILTIPFSSYKTETCTYVTNGGLEMKSERGRRANEVRQLTDSLIVGCRWKEEPIHPNVAALNPLTPTPLTNSILLVHCSTDWGQCPILTYYNIRSLMQGAWAKGFA